MLSGFQHPEVSPGSMCTSNTYSLGSFEIFQTSKEITSRICFKMTVVPPPPAPEQFFIYSKIKSWTQRFPTYPQISDWPPHHLHPYQNGTLVTSEKSTLKLHQRLTSADHIRTRTTSVLHMVCLDLSQNNNAGYYCILHNILIVLQVPHFFIPAALTPINH